MKSNKLFARKTISAIVVFAVTAGPNGLLMAGPSATPTDLADAPFSVDDAAAAAVSNPFVQSGDNTAYATSFNKPLFTATPVTGDWTGNLQAYSINITTGVPGTTGTWTNGDAGTQLTALGNNANTSRKIATYNGSTGIAFQWANLTGGQQSLLTAPLLAIVPCKTGDMVLAFLRGDRSCETKGYRSRGSLLGDTVNAEPVILVPPFRNYADTGYAAFKAANASRAKVVFQGANDGMLHAFNADPTSGGNELWAYVPSFVYGNLSMLANPLYKTTNPQTAPITTVSHRYFVDATPTFLDVDFNNTGGLVDIDAVGYVSDWHTILVGGLNKGGRGFYALDVTTPAAASDSAVAAKGLWEFPKASSPNVGYSYGRPVIVKTSAFGWVVLVTSGYNNGTATALDPTTGTGGDGLGHLYVLNAKTGVQIADITTTAGTMAAPSGLAQISAFVPNTDVDDTPDFVYGGDLLGNVWRFDLSGVDPAYPTNPPSATKWNVTPLATLVDGSGNSQAITAAPELGVVNGNRVVYVGTGKFLGSTDITTTQTQSMYALLDDQSTSPLISPLRSNLVQQTITTSGTTRTVSANAVDFATKKGWYFDFPAAPAGSGSERLAQDASLAVGTLAFTTIVPASTAGNSSSWNYTVDYRTGGQLVGSTLNYTASQITGTLASRPVVIKLPSGVLKQIIRKSDATTAVLDLPVAADQQASLSSASPVSRVSWRELQQ